jgi:hypothetical protein
MDESDAQWVTIVVPPDVVGPTLQAANDPATGR